MLATIMLGFCALLAVVPGDDDKALKHLRRLCRPNLEGRVAVTDRKAAFEAVKNVDTIAAAKALLGSYLALEEACLVIEEKRRGYLNSPGRDATLQARADLDPNREVQELLQARLVALLDPAAELFLFEQALLDRKMPVTLRLALAEKAVRLGQEGLEMTREGLKRPRNPENLLVALTATRALGENGMELAGRVRSYLDNDEPVVREACATALASLRDRAAVEPLIQRLRVEKGVTAARVAAALEQLTGRKLGTNVRAWEWWFEREGEAFLRGDQSADAGSPGPAEAGAEDGNTYHSIPILGRSILFVLDRSKSMNKSLADPKGGTAEGAETRLVRAKRELNAALGRLQPDQQFGILCFGARCPTFAPEMLPATPQRIRTAQEWVNDIELEFGTALYDALDLSFAMAGRPPADRFYSAGIDTMFVLTDGQPYRPQFGGGALVTDSNARILATVRRWNLFQRITIHTVGLGQGISKKFLTRLATENNGLFVHEL